MNLMRCAASWHALGDDGRVYCADDDHHWRPCPVIGGARVLTAAALALDARRAEVGT